MKNLASITMGAGAADSTAGRDVVDIISFIEEPWGLNTRLFPVQRVILKAYYGLPLDNNPLGFPLDVVVPKTHPHYDEQWVDLDGFYKNRVHITDWRGENPRDLTEEQYLRLLHAEGRCNIGEVVPGKERRELLLSVGRRSGKTMVSACIAAYETYRLISKGDPQAYYGVPASNTIQLISVATDKDQAGLLYQEVSGHFRNAAFFTNYTANNTQSYARFQTPKDIKRYGRYSQDPSAKATIKVTFRSCVAKGLRGAGNIVVVLDEMAHFIDNGQSGADAVYNAIVPSTAAYSPKDPRNNQKAIGPVESKIIAISSPLGKQGLFYQLFQDGFRSADVSTNRLCVQAPTWEVNLTIPADYFKSEYVKDTRSFFTEYGAEFTDRTRGWLEDSKDLMACVDPDLRPKFKAPSRMAHFAGIDIALVGDASAIAIGHLDENGKIVLDLIDTIKAGEGDFVGQDRLEFADVAAWIYDHTKKFYITEGIFDQWSGIAMEQALQAYGLNQLQTVHHTAQLTSEMFRNFKDMMYDKKLSLYDSPKVDGQDHCEYITQLLELQAETKSKYIVQVSAPKVQGKHDDMADALVRMVWLASKHVSKTANIVFAGDRQRARSGAQTQHLQQQALMVARRRAFQTGSSPERQVPGKSAFGTRGGNRNAIGGPKKGGGWRR